MGVPRSVSLGNLAAVGESGLRCTRTPWRFTSCGTNFVKIHQTLKVTPAMAAGVTDRLWEAGDIIAIVGGVMVVASQSTQGYQAMEAVMSKPTDVRFELHAIDERVKLLVLVLFGVALVTVVGFGLLVVWAS